MLKLKMQDEEQIRQLMEAKRSSMVHVKTYKNASTAFSHFVDDPSTRQKVTRNSCRLTICLSLILSQAHSVLLAYLIFIVFILEHLASAHVESRTKGDVLDR